MLLEIDYEKVQGARVKALKDGKSKNLIPFVVCDSANLADACMKIGLWKHKVPIKYTGDVDILPHILVDDNYIVVEREIQDIDLSLGLAITQIDPRVTIVFRLPEDYSNIKAVADACARYGNIRFIGGNLATLEGVRVGYIDLTDFSTRDISKLPIKTNGIEGYAPVFQVEDYDDLQFTHKNKPVSVRKAARGNVESRQKQEKAPAKKKGTKKPSLFEQFT